MTCALRVETEPPFWSFLFPFYFIKNILLVQVCFLLNYVNFTCIFFFNLRARTFQQGRAEHTCVQPEKQRRRNLLPAASVRPCMSEQYSAPLTALREKDSYFSINPSSAVYLHKTFILQHHPTRIRIFQILFLFLLTRIEFLKICQSQFVLKQN